MARSEFNASRPATAVKRPGGNGGCFQITERGSSPRVEVLAGISTFMTMAYIIFVNPAILSGAGMPFPAVAAATCIGAALPCLLLGLIGNYPIALASGMGLNAAVAFQAALPGMTWEKMMGVVVIEGCIVFVLALTGAREQIMSAIPADIKYAIGVGIGLLIAFLGLQQLGWIAKGPEGVFLTQGAWHSKPVAVGALGTVIFVALVARKTPGALLWGILATTALAIAADALVPTKQALVTIPKRWVSFPDLSLFGHADIRGALTPALAGTIFAFLISDFFDTMGTIIAIAHQGGFVDAKGNIPRLRRLLLVDSFGAIWGGLCGCSSVTTYIESAAGVSQGGRTGLVSVVVGALFLAGLFITPAIGIVPSVATAPALLLVGYLMIGIIRQIEFEKFNTALPAFLIMLLIPLTESISTGIGVGIIAYALVETLTGNIRKISGFVWVIAGLFAATFWLQK